MASVGAVGQRIMAVSEQPAEFLPRFAGGPGAEGYCDRLKQKREAPHLRMDSFDVNVHG